MKLRRGFYLFIIGLFMLTANATAQTCPAPQGANPIQIENCMSGTTAWQITGNAIPTNRQVEAYASATSINIGQTITFFVNVTDNSLNFKMEIYRMGWYGGNGGRLVFTRSGIPPKHQPLSEVDPSTGLYECNWTPPDGQAANYQWTAENTTSGVHVAKFSTRNGYSVYSIFVVRDDSRTSDILFQTSDTTWQAYNYYPGNPIGTAAQPPTLTLNKRETRNTPVKVFTRRFSD